MDPFTTFRTSTARVKQELAAWERETGMALPREADEIVWLESAGAVVDLVTGEVFRPADRWADFAARWVAERARLEKEVDAGQLTGAVERANGNGFRQRICAEIAVKTLAGVGE